MNYDFSQYLAVRHNFRLVKKPQSFFLQQHVLLHKSFSPFQYKFVRTAYGACSTFATCFTRCKKCLFFCRARAFQYRAYSITASWFLDAFQIVGFSLESTKYFRPLLLFPFHVTFISWNYLKAVMQNENVSLQTHAPPCSHTCNYIRAWTKDSNRLIFLYGRNTIYNHFFTFIIRVWIYWMAKNVEDF